MMGDIVLDSRHKAGRAASWFLSEILSPFEVWTEFMALFNSYDTQFDVCMVYLCVTVSYTV